MWLEVRWPLRFALNCYHRVTDRLVALSEGFVRADLAIKNKEVLQLRAKVEEYKENLHKVRLRFMMAIFFSEHSSTRLHVCVQEADLGTVERNRCT